MRALFLVLFLLVSCRHGVAPWEQKEMDHNDLEKLRSEAIHVPESFPQKPKTVKAKPQQPPLNDAFKKNISLSLSESLSLKQVLPEIARHQGIDLQLDPGIEEKVVFHATEQPFVDVIQQLCELANLRYKIQGRSLRIERDTPYSHNYNVQFLNLARSTENKVSIATDVFANNKGGKSNLGDNGSNSSVNMKAENDFWKELEVNLQTIMGGGEGSNASFSIHKQGGIISVKATAKQHALIRSYLTHLRKAVSTQVLIEAKVIEVNLTDQYRSGINWNKLGKPGDLRFNAPFGNIAQNARFLNPADAQSDMITFGATGHTFSSILSAMEQFGASRTLSSPRLTVLNNQTAILKVAQNEVYFRLNYNKQYNNAVNRESYNVSSDIQTVPIGLVMTVQPSIDEETGEIILSLRPTISRMTRTVRDPAVDIAFNATTTAGSDAVAYQPSLVPVVEVREIDSVLRLKTNEIGVLGGLMESRSIQDRSGLPGFSNVPVLGELVKARVDGDEIIELVILLRASIIDTAPHPDDADERLYNNYSHDPRPFRM